MQTCTWDLFDASSSMNKTSTVVFFFIYCFIKLRNVLSLTIFVWLLFLFLILYFQIHVMRKRGWPKAIHFTTWLDLYMILNLLFVKQYVIKQKTILTFTLTNQNNTWCHGQYNAYISFFHFYIACDTRSHKMQLFVQVITIYL